MRFSIDSALPTRGLRVHRARFGNPVARTISVDATGRPIHNAGWSATQAQGLHKGLGARIGPPASRGWRQMHHPRGDSCKAAQRCRRIQITRQRRDSTPAQFWHSVSIRCQRQQAHTPLHQPSQSHADVAAADDQDTFSAKT